MVLDGAISIMISHQPDIDQIYLYAKDPFEGNLQLLINKQENAGLNHFNDPKAFIECSNGMDNIYKYIEEYDLKKKRKIYFPFFIQIIFFNQYIRIVFDDMIADMLSNKKSNLIVTELIIRRRKLNIYLIFITQSYFAVPKKY